MGSYLLKIREYRIWSSMLTRCFNAKARNYPRYGGRGITVCEAWKSYVNFIRDMGPCPEGMTLERKENSGNYEPANCRWATRIEQGNNKRNNVLIEYQGAKKTTAQWAREIGIPRSRISRRLHAGWPVDAIFMAARYTRVGESARHTPESRAKIAAARREYWQKRRCA